MKTCVIPKEGGIVPDIDGQCRLMGVRGRTEGACAAADDGVTYQRGIDHETDLMCGVGRDVERSRRSGE
jgi:hypothetical protein